MSNLQRFEGRTQREAREKIRAELGEEARIVRAGKERSGGIFGFFQREVYVLEAKNPRPDRPAYEPATLVATLASAIDTSSPTLTIRDRPAPMEFASSFQEVLHEAEAAIATGEAEGLELDGLAIDRREGTEDHQTTCSSPSRRRSPESAYSEADPSSPGLQIHLKTAFEELELETARKQSLVRNGLKPTEGISPRHVDRPTDRVLDHDTPGDLQEAEPPSKDAPSDDRLRTDGVPVRSATLDPTIHQGELDLDETDPVQFDLALPVLAEQHIACEREIHERPLASDAEPKPSVRLRLRALGLGDQLLSDLDPIEPIALMRTLEMLPAVPQLPSGDAAVVLVLGQRQAASRLARVLKERFADTMAEYIRVELAAPHENGTPTKDPTIKDSTIRTPPMGPLEIAELIARRRIAKQSSVLALSYNARSLEILPGVVRGVRPDAIWAVLPGATRRNQLDELTDATGGLDALALYNFGEGSSPASLIDAGVPLAYVDWHRATPMLLAAHLLELTEVGGR